MSIEINSIRYCTPAECYVLDRSYMDGNAARIFTHSQLKQQLTNTSLNCIISLRIVAEGT